MWGQFCGDVSLKHYTMCLEKMWIVCYEWIVGESDLQLDI